MPLNVKPLSRSHLIMSQDLYLKRTLFSDNKSYTEAELLKTSNYIVILAEPGAGKTELLNNLAKQLGIKAVTASVFLYVGANQTNSPIVIDAFDELAKIDNTGIHQLFAKAVEANPTHVIISSRSSEWDNSATHTFQEFMGHKPTVVRLCEFNSSEQRDIYTHCTQKNDFEEFQAEIARFSLEPLLPNPQFLKLFADAYIESGGHFTDKQSIFTKAVENLAREANANVKPTPSISIDNKIDISSEVFAKLLLSGAEGIGISEVSESRIYPLFGSLLSSNNVTASNLLATRLFKPGYNVDQHRPVHKIVSEYCAAAYLIKRIRDPLDPLILAHCLPIIAPNSVVRDELRGLLGWMATLGNEAIEESLITLDSYAILANGDPSQLSPSSKRLLLSQLKKVEASDPYFRRGDFQRRFSIAGFFTKEVIEDIKPIITDESDGHLRDLIIELLTGSQSAKWLKPELRLILLNAAENEGARLLVKQCVLELDCYDQSSDLGNLIEESSSCSLGLAADLIKNLGTESLSLSQWKNYFSHCAKLYPSRRDTFERVIGSRYFIKSLISCFNLGLIEKLLDLLSKELPCVCGKDKYQCDCRTGKSKIIGILLDRYFQLSHSPCEPLRIWSWLENLHFPNQINTKDIISVQALRSNNELRRSIIAHVFSNLTERDLIWKIRRDIFSGHYSHAGLALTGEDIEFIVDLAYETDNPDLWASFMPFHYYDHYKEKRGTDKLRHHMREQASNKSAFMRKWAYSNRHHKIVSKQDDRKYDLKHRRLMKRYQKKKQQRYADDIQYIKDNRAQIEQGQHLGYLAYFSELTLYNTEEIEERCGDEQLVRNALKNCHSFIEPKIPDLQKLAKLQCSSQCLNIEIIIMASCLEIFREHGHLKDVNPALLTALRTNLSMSYPDVDGDVIEALKAEIDRLIFPNVVTAEKFIRQYIEPQLAAPKCAHPEVELLKYDAIFSPLKTTLSIEWLTRFNLLEHYALNELFEIAAQDGEREELNQIIKTRCSQLLLEHPDSDNMEKHQNSCKFWFIRAFYFLDFNESAPYWSWLKIDKNSVFLFNSQSGQMNRGDQPHWPTLTANKIEVILDAYIDKWPKVDLPSSYGTGSPPQETAYRFLTEIIWTIRDDNSSEVPLILDRLLSDSRFADIHTALKSIKAEQLRNRALRNFEPPSPDAIVNLLDNNAVVTVEGLRQLVLQELACYQQDINGGEFNVANRFYTKDKNGDNIHLQEVDSVEIIADRLNLRLSYQDITITAEYQTKNRNRIDITATKVIDGKRRLLVIEAKGQWHPELYSAASTQLYERYSIHPDAEHQGIYLAIWFGPDEKVANRKGHGIKNALELRKSIEEALPLELKGLIDIFVLDVSRS